MKQQIRFLAAYILLFLLSGLLHVFLYGVPFTDSIMLLIYGGAAYLWGSSVNRRIMDVRVRRLLLWIVGLIELFFLLQICNYKLFAASLALRRYCWYAYYVPMILIPQLLLLVSLYQDRPEEKRLHLLWAAPLILAVLIAAGILTNDLHQQAFFFPGGVMSSTAEKIYGPIYYIYIVVSTVSAVLAFAVMLRKCRVSLTMRMAWVPLVPLVLGVCWLVLNIFDDPLRLRGVALWNMGEIFFFLTVGFLESCIRIGLIPANTEYETIFREMALQARICDADGEARFSSDGQEMSPAGSGDVRFETTAIRGGSVVWAVDLKELRALDRQIEETTEQIRTRNEYLRSENELKEEHTALEARNRLYDTVATLLKPQLDQIQKLLAEAREGDFTANLKRMTVLNAYIKRRSNMALLLSGTDFLPVTELTLAMEESLRCLELCGVETLLTVSGGGELPAEMITLTYDFFEAVLEAVPEGLKALSAAAVCTGETLTLRLMLSGARPEQSLRDWKRPELERWRGRIETEEEEADTLLRLYLERGGEARC